jgi:putative ATP-dependent endonuclease of OLD family
MKVRRLQIENYRGIQRMDLELDDITVLIGENNTGKTAVLDALRVCLRDQGARRTSDIEPFDFHLASPTADPAGAPPITISVTFAEATVGEWPQNVAGALQRAGILQVDPADGRGQVILRVRASYDTATNDILQDVQFLDLTGNPLAKPAPSGLSALREQVSYFYLSALRDAARHFDPKGQFWRPFLRGSTLTPQQKQDIENALQAVNDQIITSHVSFDAARDKLKLLQDVVPLAAGDVVSFDAVPARIFDMLARTQISLGSATGAKIPVDRHGEGTQSLAVLMLFNAFLEAWGKGSPIIALEEPEAHLHPSAVRALWRLIERLPGQKIITTHSGNLVSEVAVPSVRRLRRGAAGISQHRLPPTTLHPEQARQFDYHVRAMRGELLLARCWLLVEGETEVVFLSELARHLGLNFERVGVSCVPYRQSDIAVYLQVANALGIRWCALTDADGQGQIDQGKVIANLGGAAAADVLFVMPEKDIETYLCASGFGAIYAAYLTPQTQARVTVAPGDPAYCGQVVDAIKKARSFHKGAAALQVLARIRAGQPVPAILENAARAAVRLAEAG